MQIKKRLCLLLACVIAAVCFCGIASASEPDENIVYLENMMCEKLDTPVVEYLDIQTSARVTSTLNATVPANSAIGTGSSISLAANETVTYDCSYSPRSASVDFGVIAPDGYFYYMNVTSGDINKGIRVNQTGNYTLAIRNNSSYTVTVFGTVNY